MTHEHFLRARLFSSVVLAIPFGGSRFVKMSSGSTLTALPRPSYPWAKALACLDDDLKRVKHVFDETIIQGAVFDNQSIVDRAIK